MEIIRVVKLEKAVKPYTRTRRGKLEHVKGHERKGLRRTTIDPTTVWEAEGVDRMDEYRKVFNKHGFRNIGAGGTYSEWLNPKYGYRIKLFTNDEVEFNGKSLGKLPPGFLASAIQREKQKEQKGYPSFEEARKKRTLGDVVLGTARAMHPEKEKFDFTYTPRKGSTQAEKDFEEIRKWQKKQIKKGDDVMEKKVLVISLDEALEKADVQPYTRTRRGKLEHVKGYHKVGSTIAYLPGREDETHWKVLETPETTGGNKYKAQNLKTGQVELLDHSDVGKPTKKVETKDVESRAAMRRYEKVKAKYEKRGEPEKAEYERLKGMADLLNAKGKSRLSELEAKHGEKEVTPETMTHLQETIKLALKGQGYGDAQAERVAKEMVEKVKAAPGKPVFHEEKEIEKEEEKPTVEGFVRKKEPVESGKYKQFFDEKGVLDEVAYHQKLDDTEKVKCLKYAIEQYKERYVEKATVDTEVWKNPDFQAINKEIGRQEGMRRAFIKKGEAYEEFSKDQRQAFRVAVNIQSKQIPGIHIPSEFQELFSKSDEVEVISLDEALFEKAGTSEGVRRSWQKRKRGKSWGEKYDPGFSRTSKWNKDPGFSRTSKWNKDPGFYRDVEYHHGGYGYEPKPPFGWGQSIQITTIDELSKARGRGRPRTEEERKERHFKKFGTRKVPPRGTGRGRECN